MTVFSDHIVFVDESGDHGLTGIDPQFPVFALAFCVLRKEDYIAQVTPAFQRFKFEFFGHDEVVLHEHEIRKQQQPFTFLRADPDLRGRFMGAISDLIAEAPFEIIASVIDKRRLVDRYPDPWNPYEIALRFCMERLLHLLRRNGQAGRLTHVCFESRGAKEDGELELEFRRICANGARWGWNAPDFSDMSFEPLFTPKASNSVGLQMADLVARPIALNTMRPGQPNRAFETLSPKLRVTKVFP